MLFIPVLLLTVLASHAQSKKSFHLPKSITTEEYKKNIIVVKLKPDTHNGKASKNIEALTKAVGGTACTKALPTTKKGIAKRNATKNNLSNIYKIEIRQGEDLVKKINQILAFDNVIYAEPYYLPKPLYVPNDPGALPDTGLQTYLNIIKAYEAWEFEKGDSSIVIGILDTGIALDHEDIIDNIKYNYNDPINGIDDDADGYLDNYYGWDMAENDNDPTYKHWHGLGVAGISSAKADNSTGIAGLGFNSKMMPIKVFRNDRSFNQGYEAILYAAEQGCQVINLSWGSPGSFSNYAKDIVDYVVEELDVVIVAAAGNTNLDLDFYPASYLNVLSVGASNNLDQKAGFATFSNKIDVLAPGEHIYTTRKGGGYGHTTGSSFSSPMVAGVAALVRSRYPNLNARQVMQKIRLAADDIYGISENSPYFEMLGKGRLNALKAVSPYNLPAVRMTDFFYEDKKGIESVDGGDTIMLKMNFINLLGETADATVSLSCESAYVTISQADFTLGQLTEMGEKNNHDAPFQVYIHPNIPNNEKLNFRLGFSDIDYDDYQYFDITVSAEHLKVDTKKIELTVNSNGRLPYADEQFSIGNGFKYKYKTMADHIGLAIGISEEKVVDNIIADFSDYSLNNDFQQEEIIKRYYNSITDIDVRSVFNDKDTIGLKIEQRIIASSNDAANDFIIIEYRLTNQSGSTLNNLYTGIFSEWNINDWAKNKAAWDSTNNLGYVFDTSENNLYSGIALISNQEAIYNAIDLGAENGNTADLDATFTKSEKFDYLSVTKNLTADGNDVANMLSSKTVSLLDKKSTKIAFVLAGAENLQDLKNSVVTAKVLYSLYNASPPVIAEIEICSGESTILTPETGVNHRFYEDAHLTTILGEGESFTTPLLSKSQSFYMTQYENGYQGNIEQIKVIVRESLLAFSFTPDTLIVSENTEVQFTDLSENTVSRNWIFEDGFTTSDSTFSKEFNAPGVYSIRLVSESENGCINNLEKQLIVLNITGIENTLRSNFKVYPNPSQGKFTITGVLNNTNPTTITVFNTMGKAVYTGLISKNRVAQSLDLRLLKPGVYLINLISDDVKYLPQKLIIR